MSVIPQCEPVLGDREKAWLLRCIDSGFVSSVGPMIGEFERRFADTVGSHYAVATASGTAALHASLHALGIGRGDLVAVPDLTFIASLNPVLYVGAEFLLIDVDPQTWCMDLRVLADACREQRRQGHPIKAVIPVHLFGCACDMVALEALAREHELVIVEDATEALGTRLYGRQVGSFGQVGCFSFNGNKMITTGAGGMVVTDSKPLADRIRYLVNQARDPGDRYQHSEMGFNYRMSNLAAALGLAQIERLPDLIKSKRALAQRYSEGLSQLPGVQLHPEPSGVTNSFWLYSIVLADADLRDHWLYELAQAGITARRFFEPLHRQPYLRQLVWRNENGKGTPGATGCSDRLSACGINLPSSAQLAPADQQRIIRKLRELAHRTDVALV